MLKAKFVQRDMVLYSICLKCHVITMGYEKSVHKIQRCEVKINAPNVEYGRLLTTVNIA